MWLPKKCSKKKLLILFTFRKYMTGVLETTFCSQISFGLGRRGKSDQNWPSFVLRGDPVGSNRKEKFETQIVAHCNMLHVSFGFFLCYNILVSASLRIKLVHLIWCKVLPVQCVTPTQLESTALSCLSRMTLNDSRQKQPGLL